MTIAPPATPTPTASRPKLPAGLKWSSVWKDDAGRFVEGEPGVELPVDAKYRLQGRLWSCPVTDCPCQEWTFAPVSGDDVPCCPRHPNRLVSAPLSAGEKNPVRGARAQVAEWARTVYERRKEQAVAAAQQRLDVAQKAASDAARRTALDMRGHAPSIAVSAVTIAAGTPLALSNEPLAAAVGIGVGTVGAVVAYMVAYYVRRIRQKARADAKAAARDRRAARHIAAGCLAAGVWLAAGAAATVLPQLVQAVFTVLFGLLLMFAVNQGHWIELWETRHRLREMARLKAEAEARRAAQEKTQAEEAPLAGDVPLVDASDPQAVGARMAAEWARIAQSPDARSAFPQMARTWIDPAATVEVTAPINGEIVRIGWEYAGHSEPGALIAGRGFTASPIVAQRDWLAAVLFNGRHDPSTVSLVDRPSGAANRFQLMVTDSVPLGEPVRWQGKAGVKVLEDGTITAHRGRALDGNDVYDAIYTPGQAFGGLVVGSRGGGKSGNTILYLLNCLAAGIFPILFDPKQLVDYADFVGVIPIGVTQQHRNIISSSLAAERKRRERQMARRPVLDEFGREVAGESLWDRSDGPPIAHVWEEFHDLAQDEQWVSSVVTNHARFERAAAMGGTFITQGGGLADLSNSVLRGLLNQTSLTTFRMDDHQARLAGRRDSAYTAADLPKLAGMCLVESPTAPPLPLRTAYVPRTLNHPESVFNQLYGRSRDKVLQLPPSKLPQATIDVFEKHGLMDLWQKAQGVGGLDRLLADAEDAESDGTSLVQVPGNAPVGAMAAADVLLAIVHLNPGCGRQTIDNHSVWAHPLAGGKTPAPSTISRAASKLESDGKLTRAKGGGDYRVTGKGSEAAKIAVAALTFTGAGVAAAKEAAAERAAEDGE